MHDKNTTIAMDAGIMYTSVCPVVGCFPYPLFHVVIHQREQENGMKSDKRIVVTGLCQKFSFFVKCAFGMSPMETTPFPTTVSPMSQTHMAGTM